MKRLIWISAWLWIGLWSCTPAEEPTTTNPTTPDKPVVVVDEVKKAIVDVMKEWYFWNGLIPATVDLTKYASNEALLDGIINKPIDRFSYLTTQEAFNNAFVGKNAGHGFGFAFTADEKLYVSFVFAESPAGKDGWKRGWEISQINGKPIADYKVTGGYDFKLGGPDPGIINSFTFKLPDGTTTTRINTKADVALGGQPAIMSGDDRPADRQSQAHALRLRGDERFECRNRIVEADPVVGDPDDGLLALSTG